VHVLLLSLDTSSPSGSLAILRDDLLLGLVATTSDEAYSSRLFRHLDFLLGDLALALKDFDLFAVASGPGSFTGLRVGLAAAKAWSEVHGKPVVGVSALEALSEQSRSRSSFIVTAMDARRGQVYFAFHRRKGGAFLLDGEERSAAPAEFLELLHPRAQAGEIEVVTPQPDLLAGILRGTDLATLAVETVSNYLAPAIGRLALARAARGQVSDSLSLEANYVRRCEAEVNWKGP
jgi:tRNA threonylcarbamoyladenosine biosynthesis protein TsaB